MLTTLNVTIKRPRDELHGRSKMAKESSIRKPAYGPNEISYDSDCQEALAGPIDKILDEAEAAGWNRVKAASALMYLSAKRLKPT